MHSKKPHPLASPSKAKTCPICGHSSYSPKGIHPQCSVSQADEPRRLELAAERRAKVDLVKNNADATQVATSDA